MIKQTSTDKFDCSRPKFSIIIFDDIFKFVVIHTINTLYNIYGDLNKFKRLNSDIKKIIKYSLLEQIYKRMILEDSNSILYINTSFTTNFSEIWSYIDKNQLKEFILDECKIISSKIPIPIHVKDEIINLHDMSGESKDTISKLYHTLIKFKKSSSNLDKLKKYTKKNGLINFINTHHSENDIKNNLLYNKYLKGASR